MKLLDDSDDYTLYKSNIGRYKFDSEKPLAACYFFPLWSKKPGFSLNVALEYIIIGLSMMCNFLVLNPKKQC